MKHGLVTNNAVRGLLYREAVRRGETRLPYSPFTIYLDPCNACNLKCTFCPQSHWGSRARGCMSWELFEHALAQVVELRPARLFLFCFGEATLNDRLADMVRAAVDARLRVRIHTNAVALTEEKARGLIEAGLQNIRFSFDTADRELYERMRAGSSFDRVVANIRRMIAIRRATGRANPVFELQEIVPYAEGVKPENTQAYRDLFEGENVVFRAKFMHSFAGQSRETEFPTQEWEGVSHCSQLYRRIVVNFDGKIHACCLDPEGYNIVADLAQGDTIAEAWNSPRMLELRRRTNEGDVAGLEPCDDCELLTRANPVVWSPLGRIASSLAWVCAGAHRRGRV